MPVFVIKNKDGMKTNVDMNVKNSLTNECVMKHLFVIPVIVSVNVINHAILEISHMKIKL